MNKSNELERARDALFHIGSGCSREEWVRIGMAAQSAGLSFDDFDEWSAGGSNYKSRADCLTVWNSFKVNGAVTPATLFSTALKQGWIDTTKATQRNANYAQSDPGKKPNNTVAHTWEICTPALESNAYIIRKRGKPDGLRVYPVDAAPLFIKGHNVAGWLVAPAWSDGQLQTLQFIPPNGGEKLNLPGASFNDGYFSVGAMPNNDYAGDIHILEGIGQAWAANSTIGSPAIVSFGAGRMVRVAKLLRAQYPDARLVIVPDKGKEADATRIAATVNGFYVVIPGDKPNNYDVNDYLQDFGADSLAALLRQTREPPSQVYQEPDIDYSTMPTYEYGETAAPPPKSLLVWEDGDEMADNAKAPEYMINDILETDSHGILGGSSRAFKTFVDLRIVFSICTGSDFFGHQAFTTGKVLYVCGEGRGALKRRIKALKIVEGAFNGNLCVLDYPLRIDNQIDMAMLRQSIETINPALVVFDTFASLVSATDENSPSEVGRALRLIKETCRYGKTSSLIIHHYGKDTTKGLRGASNFGSDVDFAFEMTRVSDSMLTTFSCKKMKDGEDFDDINMQAHVVELGIIRQDGKIATSLVLKPTNEKPDTGKKGNPLDSLHTKILAALYESINEYGIQPPQEIILRFPDSPQNCPKKVVHIKDFRLLAYPHLNVQENSKRTTLKRCVERLEDNNKCMFYNGYLWVI
jgi:putative DNA primase/helicase